MNGAATPLIRVEGLKKSFVKDKMVLDGLN